MNTHPPTTEPARPGQRNATTSNDQLRKFNLSTLMTLIHQTGGCSRAALTKRTGLTRSAVAGLVAELVELGLVTETEPDAHLGKVGRPSPIMRPNPRISALAVSCDVDAISVALVALGGKIVRKIRFETSHTPTVTEAVNIISVIIEGMRGELEEHFTVVGVGLAIPGLVRRSDGRVLIAPHLDWHNVDVVAELERAVHYPVFAGNDSSLGALAETLFGLEEIPSDLVYLHGSSSGIGGGLIVNGTQLYGSHGFAGEIGHTLVNSAGARCHCGRIGCLETEVSVAKLSAVLGASFPNEKALDKALSKPLPPAVITEIQQQLTYLREALTNVVNIFDPKIIVLGGYLGCLLSAAEQHSPEPFQIHQLGSFGSPAQITRANLGSRLTLIGPAELAFARLLEDPAGFVAGIS